MNPYYTFHYLQQIFFIILMQSFMKIILLLCSLLTLNNALHLAQLKEVITPNPENQSLLAQQEKQDNFEILKIFQKIDIKQNEKLSLQEITNFLKGMGIKQQNASDTLLREFDVDKDGYVDYVQFKVRNKYFENMKNLFNNYDQDKDSNLSTEQISTNISPKAQTELHNFDKNNDTLISYEQFRNWLGFQ